MHFTIWKMVGSPTRDAGASKAARDLHLRQMHHLFPLTNQFISPISSDIGTI